MRQELTVGYEFAYDREITETDIADFARVSGDRGAHHLEKDGKGRLLAHGLLTATLPTRLGGELNYVARSMNFDFIKPVYSGDVLTCRGRVDSVLKKAGRLKVVFSFAVNNQDGDLVMKGSSRGVIYDAKP